MKGIFVSVAALVMAAGMLTMGCSQAAPAPAPTQAPAAPKAVEPTKAPAAASASTTAPQPTAVPAKKVDFPQKGKAITFIIPYAAGGATTTGGRVFTTILEKELGTPVEIVNMPGAGAQLGLTELARAKPDGYTLGYTVFPTTISTYLDPERKAVFSRKDFQPMASQFDQPFMAVVLANSPFKTLKDLVDAAKAKPGTVTAGTSGLLAVGHLALLELERLADAKFRAVHFDGTGPESVALLGGHLDVGFLGAGETLPYFKDGRVRVLGIASQDEVKDLPGAKTMDSQGYKVYMSAVTAMSAPAGVPKEIMDILGAAAKKSMDTDEHKQKIEQLGFRVRYMDAQQLGKFWEDSEAQIKPLLERGKTQ